MSISKKHFVGIARAIHGSDDKQEAIIEIGKYLASQNPRFDREKFQWACYYGSPPPKKLKKTHTHPHSIYDSECPTCIGSES